MHHKRLKKMFFVIIFSLCGTYFNAKAGSLLHQPLSTKKTFTEKTRTDVTTSLDSRVQHSFRQSSNTLASGEDFYHNFVRHRIGTKRKMLVQREPFGAFQLPGSSNLVGVGFRCQPTLLVNRILLLLTTATMTAGEGSSKNT